MSWYPVFQPNHQFVHSKMARYKFSIVNVKDLHGAFPLWSSLDMVFSKKGIFPI